MGLTKTIAASIAFFALCGPSFGQYMDFRPNFNACIQRNEYRACQQALKFTDVNSTPEEREQIRAKMRAIDAAAAQPKPAPNAQPSQPARSPYAPSPSPLDDLEKPFQQGAQLIGTVFQGIFFIIAAIVALFLFLTFSQKSKEKHAWAELPKDGPMQVNIEEQMTEAGSFNSKRVKCGLKIDVKISQADWKAIAAAGLMKKVLFHADGPSGDAYDPENVRPWLVEDLKNTTYASFWDTDRMAQGKEELITSLYNLREHIDDVRAGPKKESFEI